MPNQHVSGMALAAGREHEHACHHSARDEKNCPAKKIVIKRPTAASATPLTKRTVGRGSA